MELNIAIPRRTFLTSLPPELFEKIVADVLEVVGMFKAVRLRAVDKRFDVAIVHAIYDSYLHDKDGPVYIQLARRIRLGKCIHPQMMGVFLLAELEHCHEHHVLSPVRDAIQAFHGKEDEETLCRTKRLVCEAMSPHLFWGWGRSRELGFRVNRHRSGHTEQNPRTVQGESAQIALCLAIVINDLSSCQALIAKYPHVNFASKYFGRPLQLAVRWASDQIVQVLLDHGADPVVDQYVAGPDGSLIGDHGLYYSTRGAALQVAALAGKEDIVRLLLQPKYSTNLSEDIYRKSVECAARIGHTRIILTLMESLKSKFCISELEMLERVFFIACYHGREELAKLILHKGVRVNSLSTRLNMSSYPSALQLAAIHGHVNILRLLLDHGIDLHYSLGGKCGQAIDALTFSAIKGYEEAVQVLLDYGADLNATVGGIDLQQVALRGESHMLEFLLKQGADLSRLSEDGKTRVGDILLVDASRRGNLPIVQVLVRAGVPLNNPDQVLDPVANAVAYGKTHVLNFLLHSGGQEIDLKDIGFVPEFEDTRHLGEAKTYDQRSCHWIGRY